VGSVWGSKTLISSTHTLSSKRIHQKHKKGRFMWVNTFILSLLVLFACGQDAPTSEPAKRQTTGFCKDYPDITPATVSDECQKVALPFLLKLVTCSQTQCRCIGGYFDLQKFTCLNHPKMTCAQMSCNAVGAKCVGEIIGPWDPPAACASEFGPKLRTALTNACPNGVCAVAGCADAEYAKACDMTVAAAPGPAAGGPAATPAAGQPVTPAAAPSICVDAIARISNLENPAKYVGSCASTPFQTVNEAIRKCEEEACSCAGGQLNGERCSKVHSCDQLKCRTARALCFQKAATALQESAECAPFAAKLKEYVSASCLGDACAAKGCSDSVYTETCAKASGSSKTMLAFSAIVLYLAVVVVGIL